MSTVVDSVAFTLPLYVCVSFNQTAESPGAFRLPFYQMFVVIASSINCTQSTAEVTVAEAHEKALDSHLSDVVQTQQCYFYTSSAACSLFSSFTSTEEQKEAETPICLARSNDQYLEFIIIPAPLTSPTAGKQIIGLSYIYFKKGFNVGYTDLGQFSQRPLERNDYVVL